MLWSPIFPCVLAPFTLTWAAFSLLSSCSGFPTRYDVSQPCSWGAKAPHCFFNELLFTAMAMASHTPWSARTHHPPSAPVSPRVLLCGSLSHSLPLLLSYPLFPSLSPSLHSSLTSSHSLSLSSPSPSHCVPLSLSLSHKRGFRDVRCFCIFPRVRTLLNGQKRCDISTGPRRVVVRITALIRPASPRVSSPVMRIAFRMGVCSAACRGTAQRPRVPGQPV